ncbi:MAG: Bug family tripartite tricarboxylate transporter substrate binding protein [Burkholderiales bacterium]
MARLVGVVLMLALAQAALAQVYPNRAVRIIVPTVPGGSIDITARTVANKLGELWGQSVVIDNRAGASMIIGAELAAKSTPDGYTLFVAHDGTMSINPVVFSSLPYRPHKDFIPISLMTAAPLVIMVDPAIGVDSIQELIAYARANPGKLNHATGGSATLLALELFNSIAKVNIVSVPYKGAAPAIKSILAGETQVCIADTASAAAVLRSGKVKPLAVTSARRFDLFPDLPTATDSGAPGYVTRTWIAAFAPAGTPADIVNALGEDIRRVLRTAEMRERFASINMEVHATSASELARTMDADTEKWERLIRERGIKLMQ